VATSTHFSKDVLPYHWLPPECWTEDEEKRKASPKTDVWSFGVTLWEMVTLSLPYNPLTPNLLKSRLGDANFTLLPFFHLHSLFSELSVVIEMCLQMEREKRPKFSQLVRLMEDQLAGMENELRKQEVECGNRDFWKPEDPNEHVTVEHSGYDRLFKTREGRKNKEHEARKEFGGVEHSGYDLMSNSPSASMEMNVKVQHQGYDSMSNSPSASTEGFTNTQKEHHTQEVSNVKVQHQGYDSMSDSPSASTEGFPNTQKEHNTQHQGYDSMSDSPSVSTEGFPNAQKEHNTREISNVKIQHQGYSSLEDNTPPEASELGWWKRLKRSLSVAKNTQHT